MVHLACLTAVWTGVTWSAVGLCLLSYLLRIVALSICYHRYFAHRSFKTARATQFLLAVAGSCAMERGPLWWADTHRRHHRHADTPEDIHSPRYHGFWYAHLGWFADPRYRRTDLVKVSDLAEFPELVWLDRWHHVVLVLFASLMFWLFGWTGIVWGVFVSSVLIWHVTHCIQSVSHRYGGYRRWPTQDESRNHWLIALVTLGDWHNNHHFFPSSARQGSVWWEVDIVYCILRMMAWTGLIWDLRKQPQHVAPGTDYPIARRGSSLPPVQDPTSCPSPRTFQ